MAYFVNNNIKMSPMKLYLLHLFSPNTGLWLFFMGRISKTLNSLVYIAYYHCCVIKTPLGPLPNYLCCV